MSKRFGQSVLVFVALAATMNLAGCRTTTSKLASVPGLGWMERGEEEGWAKYEPAPGLPKPSSTSEPTFDRSSGSALASKDSGSSGRSSFASTNVGPKPRFDASRFSPSGLPKGEKVDKSFGDYASAYGKYGPPKSGDESLAAPQKGMYSADTPNYASKSSSSTGGYGGLAGQSKPKTDDTSNSPYGYAAKSRYDSGITSSASSPTESSPTYTASANSRFGASAYESKSTTPKPYTPPGFVTSPTTLAENAKSTVASGTQKARDYLGNAEKALMGSVDELANTPKYTSNAIDGAAQPFNRYAETATKTVNDIASSARSTVATKTDQIVNQGQTTFNQYADSAANTANQYLGAAQNKIDSAKSAANETLNAATSKYNNAVATATEYANGFGATTGSTPAATTTQNPFSNVQKQVGGQIQNYAQQAKSSFEQSAASTYEQAKSTAGQYATATADTIRKDAQSMANTVANSETVKSATSTANNFINSARNSIGNASTAVSNAANGIGQSAQNVMQTVSAQAPTAYPSTATPNPFVVSGNAARSSNPVAPTGNTAAPPSFKSPAYQSPATTAPPTTIQRSTTPFRPGSTSTFQGAMTTKKQAVELASATATTSPSPEHLVLAVGDQYQFPVTLR